MIPILTLVSPINLFHITKFSTFQLMRRCQLQQILQLPVLQLVLLLLLESLSV
jgi:hypothetical protein